jgi:hypothetical protein
MSVFQHDPLAQALRSTASRQAVFRLISFAAARLRRRFPGNENMIGQKNSDKWHDNDANHYKQPGSLAVLFNFIKSTTAPICALLAARYTPEKDDDVLGEQVTLPDALVKPGAKNNSW